MNPRAAYLPNLRLFASAVVLLIAFTSVARAELRVLHIDPAQTGAGIESVHGPHLALYDPQVPSNHRLLLYFVGTGVRAEAGLVLGESFARLGYHVISLDYENTVIAASCVHSSDSSCFDAYRAAIVSGTPGSDKINVNAENTILNRFQKLLAYLVQQSPGEGWNDFLAGGKPAWNRIVLAGHSQGSGHAAYIAKLYPVDKAILFSGPQDYLSDLDKPAPWESRPSATPPSRLYAFLNLHDPFNEAHQLASCETLMQLHDAHPFMVEPGQTVSGTPQILITDADATHAHGSTVSPQFESVWKYLGTVGEQSEAPAPGPVP